MVTDWVCIDCEANVIIERSSNKWVVCCHCARTHHQTPLGALYTWQETIQRNNWVSGKGQRLSRSGELSWGIDDLVAMISSESNDGFFAKLNRDRWA